MAKTPGEPIFGPDQIEIIVDGKSLRVYPGITLAHALYAHGIRTLRKSTHRHTSPGMFCGMGVCFECTLTVNGLPFVRACMRTVEPGMVVGTG